MPASGSAIMPDVSSGPRRVWRSGGSDGKWEPPARRSRGVWLRGISNSVREPPFLLNAARPARIGRLVLSPFQRPARALREKADLVCQGQFSFLGIEFQRADPIPWQQDPKTGANWPAKFHADVEIPFCDGTGSQGTLQAIKVRLGAESARVPDRLRQGVLSDRRDPLRERVFDGDFFVVARQSLSSWRELGWAAGSRRPCRRLAVGVPVLPGLGRPCPRYPIGDCQVVLPARALSLSPLGGLHKPQQSFGRRGHGPLSAGLLLPGVRRIACLARSGWDVLVAEPERQFYADGGSTEQATSYHHYCLGFFLLAVLTRLRQRLPVPESMLERAGSGAAISACG